MRESNRVSCCSRITGHFVIMLMILVLALGVFTVMSADTAGRAYAGTDSSAELKQGDFLTIKEGTWEHEYIVLNPKNTNTKKPGIFVLQKDYPDKTAFNDEDADLESANSWENSLAQKWCADYYSSMPDTVRNSVIGVRTVETESGFKWAGVNNIDGTRTGKDINKDKVFFLSFIEYDTYRDCAGITTGEKWLLRSPYACGDLKVYVCAVTEDGEIHDFGTSWPAILGARPAFNIEPGLADGSSGCRHGNNVTWSVGNDGKAPGYDNVTYRWSSDNRSCTAAAHCNNCGRDLCETAEALIKTTAATETAEGKTTYTVSFDDDAFSVQTKVVKIPKKTAKKPLVNKKLPRPVLKTVTRKGGAITVRWKAISKSGRRKISGIQVMAATDKKFRKNRVIKTAGKTKKALKIKSLKKKKTYWVRVRTYKTAGGVRYYGKWSKVRKVKK